MKWLLVVLVMNSPVKTDLIYSSLNECLSAEREMRKQWVEIYNDAVKRGAEKSSLDFVKGQMVQGTCIPTAGI